MNEAEKRKIISLQILTSEGIPFIDHLPAIEAPSESSRRNEKEVVQRAIALAIVAVHASYEDRKLTLELVDEFKAVGLFSKEEQDFIQNHNPDFESRTKFSWRFESVNTLLWALQFFEELAKPYVSADVQEIAEIMRSLGLTGLLDRANLREQSQLLDQTDLYYRYHWAVVEADLKGEPLPGDVLGRVIEERHLAFNWLIDHEKTDWDHISTNT